MASSLWGGPVPARLQPYHQLIGRHLDTAIPSSQATDAYRLDEKWGMPKIYAPMMEDLLYAVRARNPAVTVEQLQRGHTLSSGHVDYQRKLACYCADLADGVPA